MRSRGRRISGGWLGFTAGVWPPSWAVSNNAPGRDCPSPWASYFDGSSRLLHPEAVQMMERIRRKLADPWPRVLRKLNMKPAIYPTVVTRQHELGIRVYRHRDVVRRLPALEQYVLRGHGVPLSRHPAWLSV